MEFKKPLLSRLFRGKAAETAEPEEAAEAALEEFSPPQPELDGPPRYTTLELPQEHAIFQLWSLRSQQAGWLPRPSLCLGDPAAMEENKARQDLLRLQMLVNSSANARLAQLQPKKTEDAGPPVPPDLDAQAVVYIAQDNLTAWILVYPPCGKGREVDREILDKALASKKVCYGFDEELLDGLAQSPNRYFQLFPVARGSAAVPGADGWIEDLFPRVEKRELTVDEHNRVDYTNLNFIHNVEQGGVICRILSPTDGVPGRNVLGKEIPVRVGKPVRIPKGRNTVLSEDGKELLAAIPGHVEFDNRGFQVKPLMEIDGNVDYSVGNINFVGDVCVHGDICSGFTVRAMGNITVDGVVEACTVEAGGDLVVARGIQGDSQAIIRAQRSIFAKFLENSCIYVKEQVNTECIINCDVYCDGVVTVRSGRKTIIGGKIKAAREVSAGIIGSRSETRTNIVLGGQPCQSFDYDMLAREIRGMETELEQLEPQPESPSKFNRISKLKVQLAMSQNKLSLLDKERKLQETDDPDLSQCRMTCDTVFPNTILAIGDASYRFSEKLRPCLASLEFDEICII
ncbi:MAG: DUF342 domain-containing protein [Oscillibacter sp.]|nr:DUF342 domain-containing protein [Oscillibacter sp.]